MYLLDKMGESNPQLLRELKGRFKPVNLAIITAISLVGQVLLLLYYSSRLPLKETWNRYCGNDTCFFDLQGQVVIIRELWWLDIFITLSIAGIFVLLVGGIYLLIADVADEEKRGTLNFVRLSPAGTGTIFLGKILGVPSLLYVSTILALPLHWLSGLQAGIPGNLILSYYLVLGTGLFCSYSLALLYSLITPKLGGFQPWLASGGVLVVTIILVAWTQSKYHDPVGNVFDWLLIFYPGTLLHYLVKATFLAPDTVDYLNLDNLADLDWYGKSLLAQPITGVILILSNYALWSYWAWLGIKRRFHNPASTVLSKRQSYWLSFSFIFFSLGFTLQDNLGYDQIESFSALQLANLGFCLLLIVILTPQGQTLQDWARYRHQQPLGKRHLLRDLCLGEKSPSVLAIAINLTITTLYIIPSLFVLVDREERLPILWGWLLSANLILICSLVVQLWLQGKHSKRVIWAIANVGAITILPMIIFATFGFSSTSNPWLFSLLPTVATSAASSMAIFMACMTQWLAIAILTGTMTYKLRNSSVSETKMLTTNK